MKIHDRALKLWLTVAFVFTTTGLALAQSSGGVVHIEPEKVAAAIAKGGTLLTASDLIISGSHRERAGQVEVHEKETDVLYILEGEATFVTGGKMEGGRNTRAGQWLGTSITGGDTHHLVKDDVYVVPAGTPHWFKEVPKSISYFVVKVLKP